MLAYIEKCDFLQLLDENPSEKVITKKMKLFIKLFVFSKSKLFLTFQKNYLKKKEKFFMTKDKVSFSEETNLS